MGLVSHPFNSTVPRVVISMHRARLLRPLTAALCVSVVLLASHTPTSTDSPPLTPRSKRAVERTTQGCWHLIQIPKSMLHHLERAIFRPENPP